jgi:hypothetical protein
MGASGWHGNWAAGTPVHVRRQLLPRTEQPGAGATLDGRATQVRLPDSTQDHRTRSQSAARYFEYWFDTGELHPNAAASPFDQSRAAKTIEILDLNRSGACTLRKWTRPWCFMRPLMKSVPTSPADS